jgi:membrane protein
MARSKVVLLAKRTIQEFLDDKCMTLAASVAYYGLFSLFPLLLLLIAIFSYVLQSPRVQEGVLGVVGSYLPGSQDFVAGTIQGVLRVRGSIGVVAAVTLLWSATAIFSAAATAVNLAWDIERHRPFLKQKALDILLLLGVGFFLILSLSSTAFFRFLSSVSLPVMGFRPFGDNLGWRLLSGLFPFVSTVGIFVLIYKFLPYTKVRWRDAWVGAIAAGLLFELVKNLFAWYTQNIARYNLIYGSVGTVVVLMMWIYVSAVILLLGAELSSEYSRIWRTAEDAEEKEKPAQAAVAAKPLSPTSLALYALTIAFTGLRAYLSIRAGSRRKKGRFPWSSR